MKAIIITIFCFVIFVSNNIFSQEKKIGVDIAHGISMLNYNTGFISYNSLDFVYSSHPKKSFFTFNAGLSLVHRRNNTINMTCLRTPFGLDVVIGRKFSFIIGGGLYFSYLISHKGFDEIGSYKKTFSRYQLGSKGNLGFSYEVSKKLTFIIIGQFNRDLTFLYKENSPSFGNKIRGTDIFVKIGLAYKL